MRTLSRKHLIALFVGGTLAACRCGSHEEPPRDIADAAVSAHDAGAPDANSRGADAHQTAEVDERPLPGTPIVPAIDVEEDEDSKEPQLHVHGLPALSEDGKLLAVYFTNHGVVTTAEQSLVIIDVAKRAETSKLVLVRQGELSELDEDNPTRHTAAIRARATAANQLLKKSRWKVPIYKDGTELELGDDEKQPPIDLGSLRLRVDEEAHTLILERTDNDPFLKPAERLLLEKNIKSWSNIGKPISLSDLVLVPFGNRAGLLVLVSSEFDGDPNPRRALRIVAFGAAPAPAPSASTR